MLIERIGQTLFLPTVLFGFAFFAAGQESRLPADAKLLVSYLPYMGLLLVAVIASFLNRSRTLLTASFALMILLSHQYSELNVLSSLMLAVIPISTAVLAWLPEKGTLTASGMFRITVTIGLIFGLFYLAANFEEQLGYYLEWQVFPFWTPLLNSSQGASLLALTALLATFLASYIKQSPIDQSLFGANIGLVFVLLFSVSAGMEITFIFTVSLLLAIGLLRDYHNMAYRDELTGLPQRRALNESMNSLGGRYCIAMLDVDHFKKFNDTHGHDVGDQVLQMVASQIKKVSGGGKAYRYGGEEFTIVFNYTSIDDAVHHLEQVRANIQNYEMVIRAEERTGEDEKGTKKSRKRGSFRKAEKKVSVTISIGVCQKTRGDSPETVIKKADEALYRAKKAGRNKVAT